MTKAAKAFGKFLPNFTRSAETKEYVRALSAALGAPVEITVAVPGNQYTPSAGTWCHPKLAVFFARWLDVRFAVWCDLMKYPEVTSG
ncbi:hypothetical protein GH865_11790 [Rhodocyclus tenuis]|nr:hypothetical protein [Rhodocyclus gracilis]